MESPISLAASVNNTPYDQLGERWYEANDDPVALLRAESRLRNPWLAKRIRCVLGDRPCRVLDVGCGAGFLSNHLAALGHHVVGIDAAEGALAVAARHDHTKTVMYRKANALALPFESASFDVVCAMDFLEHVEQPARAIAEAARVLAEGGLFFFHTFNRTWLAWLVAVRGVEWFVRNTPRQLHVLRLFLTPDEVAAMGLEHGLMRPDVHGCRPRFNRAFFKLLATGRVPEDFEFMFTPSTLVGFTGVAQKGRA